MVSKPHQYIGHLYTADQSRFVKKKTLSLKNLNLTHMYQQVYEHHTVSRHYDLHGSEQAGNTVVMFKPFGEQWLVLIL